MSAQFPDCAPGAHKFFSHSIIAMNEKGAYVTRKYHENNMAFVLGRADYDPWAPTIDMWMTVINIYLVRSECGP